MFEFGVFIKTKVEYSNGELKIDGRVISPISVVYVNDDKGYVYFSRDGTQASTSVHIKQRGFFYAPKQLDDVQKLLVQLDKDIESGDDLFNRNKRSNESKPKKENKHAIKCPKCKSTNVQHIGNKRKGFSVGKAIGGGLLTGGIGTLAGFAGKKGKKDNWVCMECGKKFTK